MTFGHTIESQNLDILVETIEKIMAEFSLTAVPMGWAVGVFPTLQYLPDGFPGTRFEKTARNGANQSKRRLSSHADSSDVRWLLVSTGCRFSRDLWES